MKIYTLVEKTYDWHEFNEFICSSCNIDKIKNIAEKENDFIPLLFSDNKEDVLISNICIKDERKHYYVYVSIDD